MPLKQKTSGAAAKKDSGSKKRKQADQASGGKRTKPEFDFSLEKGKEGTGTVIVRATVHGDLCDFNNELGLGDGAHLASGSTLESCLTHVFNFLKDEDQLRHVPVKMRKQTHSVTITLPTKTADYMNMLKYKIGVLLPVALLASSPLQHPSEKFFTPSPKKRPSVAETEALSQLHKEIEELRRLRMKEVTQFEEKTKSRQGFDENAVKTLVKERDELKLELREQLKEHRTSLRELQELRKEKTHRIEAGLKEMASLKHQKSDLEHEIVEKKRAQAQEYAEFNNRMAQQLAAFGEIVQRQHEQAQHLSQQIAGTPSPGGASVVSYVLDTNKYPLGCRLRAEPAEESKYHTNKGTGEPIILSPQAPLYFCNSRHNGFSKVKTATGPAGFVRSKYLLPVHPPDTPMSQKTSGSALISPGSVPTPSQPVFTEGEAVTSQA